MRELVTVIDQMLALIPADQEDLRRALASVKSSAVFTAPEWLLERWHDAAHALQRNFGDDPSAFYDWQKRVLAVWKGPEEVSS